MKEKRIRKPIRSIVIAIILTVMIPVNLLGIMTYVSVYVYVKETLVATQQGVLDHYAEQMEGGWTIQNRICCACYPTDSWWTCCGDAVIRIMS